MDGIWLMDIRKRVLSRHTQLPAPGMSVGKAGLGDKVRNSVLMWDVVFEMLMSHSNQDVI